MGSIQKEGEKASRRVGAVKKLSRYFSPSTEESLRMQKGEAFFLDTWRFFSPA